MDKEKKNNGKKKLIITMAVALTLLVGVTVSYGYIAILGNSKNQEVSVGTGDIHLVFDDADTSNVNATLKLGEAITKTFKIENKGTKPGRVQINWKNLVNTYNSRSLSYTLETSSNKDTGYTSVEALRENVPVSTEAKEVPLSKEITVPVQSAPIYYRVTITFNNLSDVDQSGDLSATLSTQFSLSEPENLSKKVIAVLDGNVKTNDPDISSPAPRYLYGVWTEGYDKSEDMATNISDGTDYIIYSDDYEIDRKGNIFFKNAKSGKYQDIYTSLPGKYMALNYCALSSESEVDYYKSYCNSMTKIEQITETTIDKIKYKMISTDKEYPEPGDFETTSPQSMVSYQNNYMVFSDTYRYDKFGGRFILVNPQICKWSECYTSLKGKYITRTTGGSQNKLVTSNTTGAIIYRVDNTDINNIYLSKRARSNDPVIDHTHDGIYKMQDDYGDSYYYRGSISNNYVKFANQFWKILRVNGDGSVRMILATNDETLWGNRFLNSGEGKKFNEKIDDIKYAGYMFGGSTENAASTSIDDAFENKYSSNVKKAIDAWYEANLTTYSSYISDTLFCNDREIGSTEGNNNHFKSFDRLYTDLSPSLKCTQKNDRFTVDDETVGNGDLTYPIGMISADEVSLAGLPSVWSLYGLMDSHFLINYYDMHTMTPAIYNTSSITFWTTTSNNMSLELYSNPTSRISPVINIKPEYALKMTGSGTVSDPFVIPGLN